MKQGYTLPRKESHIAELPGAWYFPWIGSLITGGGRLLLALIEYEVKKAGGSYVMTDTDSMAVISTKQGGWIREGNQRIRILPWNEINRITQRIQKLSPYGNAIKLLKVDKVTHDKEGKQHQLYAVGYSAKRYCLRTRKEIVKPSEHGLGPYFNPAYKGDKMFYTPEDCAKDDKYLRWIVELWEFNLGLRRRLPRWALCKSSAS